MLHDGSHRRLSRNILFWLALIPLCLSIGSFIFLNFSLISYLEERHNERIYLNTQCFLNGTISLNEPCKDDICWWPISFRLCSPTFRLCLKTFYVIVYANNQKAFTDIRPPWAEDDETDTICYYDKTKSGILRWEKANPTHFVIEILFETLILTSSIVLWIVWLYIKKINKFSILTNTDYHILSEEL